MADISYVYENKNIAEERGDGGGGNEREYFLDIFNISKFQLDLPTPTFRD